MADLFYKMRFSSDQKDQIRRAIKLRSNAIDLRVKVSQGAYDRDDWEKLLEMISSAGVTLMSSNSELSQRGDLSEGFFTSLVRDKRRPKFPNFLKALTGIIEVANDRLYDVDRSTKKNSGQGALPLSVNLQQSQSDLQVLASSLASMARSEIERLDSQRPNDLEAIDRNDRMKEILRIFSAGFERIAAALTLEVADDSSITERSRRALNAVGAEVEQWLRRNKSEVADWILRLPVLAAGVSVLSLAGAEMTIGTAAVAAIVGGDKVAKVIKETTQK